MFTMENTRQVFCSEITRTDYHPKSDLNELLKITPAKPLEIKNKKIYTCDFVPRTDKVYIPKRRPRYKVRTVRDIRALFENDTNNYLANDLESQQKYLLNRIKNGTSQNEHTQNIAKKMLNSNEPLSRTTWQMLANLNPYHNNYPQQCVLWKGKWIKVTGSKGGPKTLIYNSDLSKFKIALQFKNKYTKNKITNRRKGLLRNSLVIKFKPGPLGRKKFLDDSHQKYHGDIELINLPKVGFTVEPNYGKTIEPRIANFLSNVSQEDGVISEKWAEFSVSVLGKTENSEPRLLTEDSVTFDLKYKCDQHRILMRKDLDKLNVTSTVAAKIPDHDVTLNTLPDVNDMLKKILDAVVISVDQDNVFTTDTYLDLPSVEKITGGIITPSAKDKTKRKYCELDRLDVTVIRIPENTEHVLKQCCRNAYCTLGCICDSLKNTYHFKQHCGREECMFNCKCDVSKNINLGMNSSDSTSIIPGIIKIEKEINMRLAKEEQKFHQTVIVTGEQSILLKSEERNVKSSKKYDNIYSSRSLKNVYHDHRVLSVSVLKLNCENIEPWCMVHNLYKCFCRGKFTASSTANDLQNVTKVPTSVVAGIVVESSLDKIHDVNDSKIPLKPLPRLRPVIPTRMKSMTLGTSTNTSVKVKKTLTVSDILNKQQKHSRLNKNSESSDDFNNKNKDVEYLSDTSVPYNFYLSDYNGTCARGNPYAGRKFSEGHYKDINQKINEFEKNDKTLQKKMLILTNKEEEIPESPEIKLQSTNAPTMPTCSEQLLTKNNIVVKDTQIKESFDLGSSHDKNFMKFLYDFNDTSSIVVDTSKKRVISSENKLVGWLESHYKQYKKRIEEGAVKASLEPPKAGKVALHSWEFILSRYRERKNLFLISKQTPYRIFMGVHIKNSFFESCMNINEIRFADLHKYPQTVKNLLTNATDLKDNFCILRGLAHCWELVGSVAKVSRNDDNAEIINRIITDPQSVSDPTEQPTARLDDTALRLSPNEQDSISESVTETESSKWFIMTVENDFSEIRFYKKGFFVKYESIIKAINVARLSGKTVRLSSQKCVEKSSGPQFGIYAIPNTSEYCVFIGPYEMGDSLGVETVKSILDVGKTKRTRGFWMNTNKIDNLKVIDNPMLFIPLSDLKKNESLPLENHYNENTIAKEKETLGIVPLKECTEKQQASLHKLESKKMVKPIKIRKTNGFYHLASTSLLKTMSLQNSHTVILRPSLYVNRTDIVPNNGVINFDDCTSTLTRPGDIDTEEAPQIKIAAVYSQRDEQNKSKNEKGMSILKPEEINRRLFVNQLPGTSSDSISVMQGQNVSNTEYSSESPGFKHLQLTTCTVNDDICIISDDDNESCNEDVNEESWKQVLILCIDQTDLGWIWGRQKSNSRLLSFKVPGGEYTEFYHEDIVFSKLNSELSKIVGPSKPFDFQWRVIDSLEHLKTEVSPLDFNNLQKILHEQKSPHSVNVEPNSSKNDSRSSSPSMESIEMIESPSYSVDDPEEAMTEAPTVEVENSNENEAIEWLNEDCL